MVCGQCGEFDTVLTPSQVAAGQMVYLCSVCRVGEQDAVQWLLDHAIQEYERAWGYRMKYGNGSLHGGASLLLSREGKAMRGRSGDPSVVLGLIIRGDKAPQYMINYDITIYRWIDGGRTAITHIGTPTASIMEIDGLLRGALASTWALVDEGRVHCASCSEILTRDRVAGRHFAGVFCDHCWAKYKATNSVRCGLCGSPQFECVC
jgi:hypothetical protein